MFYQNHSQVAAEGLKLENGIDFSFPLHLHSSFEFIVVTEGEMKVVVDSVEYVLHETDALLIFPNQLHELKTDNHSCHFLCIFSPKLVKAYSRLVALKIPENNMFTPDFRLVEALASITKNDSVMSVKGVLYTLCGEFDKNASYTQKKIAEDDLLSKIFSFVENNYNGNCSLEALAQSTSYHYVYLSKFFKNATNLSYTDYVNRYRISEACYLLYNENQTILKTAFDCGFDSLRSFNRNFKNIMGMTPGEYQKNNH